MTTPVSFSASGASLGQSGSISGAGALGFPFGPCFLSSVPIVLPKDAHKHGSLPGHVTWGQQEPQEDHGAGWETCGLLRPFSLILLTSGAKVSQHHVVHSWGLRVFPQLNLVLQFPEDFMTPWTIDLETSLRYNPVPSLFLKTFSKTNFQCFQFPKDNIVNIPLSLVQYSRNSFLVRMVVNNCM